MALTTFQGPVKSLKGFYAAGPGTVISLTTDTTLTVAAHAGKIMVTNDADGKFTLPTIDATADSAHTGPGPDPNNTNNVGSTYTFIVETAATDMDILTDGTDKFVGGLYTGVDDATGKTFISGAANDVITMNGTTKGGLVGSVVVATAMANDKYHITGFSLGSGTLVTPFANS
jgi:hypothetical protein